MATVVLTTKPLTTGYSKDIHGTFVAIDSTSQDTSRMEMVKLPVKSRDEYRRLALIGRGTYGDVMVLGRMRCLNEVALLQQLPAHPNIVRFHEAFWAKCAEANEQVLVLILEHADGGDLEQYLQTLAGPILEDEARRVFVQLVHGVHHLHAHRVVHRDLKCGNVFLFQSGQIVLGDFGTSKLLLPSSASDQELEGHGLTSTVVGSPLYMSPELLEGEPHGFATDIWSLGCVLYELLSGGKPAFAALSYPAVVFRITQGGYDPLSSAVVSSQARDLVTSMLMKTPQERPSIADVLQSSWVQMHSNTGNTNAKAQTSSELVETITKESEEAPAAELRGDLEPPMIVGHPTALYLPPAPLHASRRSTIAAKSAPEEPSLPPPPAPALRSAKLGHRPQRHRTEASSPLQDRLVSPLIRFDVQPPPPPVLPSKMHLSKSPFKQHQQQLHSNRLPTEPLVLEVGGGNELIGCATLRLVVPLLLALHALVEGGGRLVGRADLDLHEVGLGELAVRAAGLGLVHVLPGLVAAQHVVHLLALQRHLLLQLVVDLEQVRARLAEEAHAVGLHAAQ
ncbi:hypothetical protein ON010_g2584 [Phytophthora cinnamomi]|nr:hypothetical protein ON010_g2584 [Phytophthora cinnamomi]